MSDAFYVGHKCRTLLKTLKYMIQLLYEFGKEQASNGNVRHFNFVKSVGHEKHFVLFHSVSYLIFALRLKM